MTTRPNVSWSRRQLHRLAVRLAVAGAVGIAVSSGVFTSTAAAEPAFTRTTTFSTATLPSTGYSPVRTASAPDGTAFITWITYEAPATAMVAVRPPGGNWSTQAIGPAEGGAGVPIGVAGDGTATLLIAGPDGALRTSERQPGGTFSPTRALTIATGRRVDRPSLSVSRNGTAVAAWFESANGGTTWTPRTRLREGGNWAGPTYDLAAAGARASDTFSIARMSTAINDAGRAAVGFTAFDGTYTRARVAIRPAGADFLPASSLEPSATHSSWIDLAITDAGAIGATYGTSAAANTGLATGFARFAPAGSDTFGIASGLSPSSFLAPSSPPSITSGPGEAFTLAASHTATTAPGPSQVFVGKALSAGGQWVALLTTPVSMASEYTAIPELAISPGGARLLSWYDAGAKTVRAAFSPAGAATYGVPLTAQSGGTVSANWPSVTMDDQGNGFVGWINVQSGFSDRGAAAAAGFDTVAPTISNLSIPGTGPAVFPIPLSATATDAWSTPKLKWSFGDGATADGSSTSHSYESPNTYDATVTATDDAGNSSSAGGKIAVSLGDRDGDGVLSDRDCDDGNAGVRPGIRDIPGNGLDENCDGADAKFGTLATTVRLDWILTRRGVRITSLGVRGVKLGDTIKLSCTGRGCPKKLKQQTVTIKKEPKKAQISLSKYAAGASLPAGAKLDVSVSRPDYKTRSTTWTVRRSKGPRESVRCQIPGAKRSEPCA